ncbi:MAG: ABC transporter ATP-binding protein [Armatimonadota bacterium]|nr:ABC transporter ATP-binding protein [Armatimonadota bacterium]
MRLICRDVTKTYLAPQGNVLALDRISFSTSEAEFVCLVGPSGCGKTTLLKIIAGLVRPTGGEVRYEGPRTGAPLNAMVFQEDSIFPWMSVLDNVAFPLEIRGMPLAERRQIAREFVDRVGLTRFAGHLPGQLSTGMRQRVGIARAFACNPQVLLMDEPFAALDAQMKAILQEELLALWSAHARTIVYVTHDIDEAIFMADRVLVLSTQPGRIVAEVPVPFARPRRPALRGHAEFLTLREHLWSLVRGEVMKVLGGAA